MTPEHLNAEHYDALRKRLTELQSAPVPDLPAIDEVINALAEEQLRLKSLDGQHGNNPIEWRHRGPPES